MAHTSARIKASAAVSKAGVRPGVKLIESVETPRHLLSAEERKKRKKAETAHSISISGNDGKLTAEENQDIPAEHDMDSADEDGHESGNNSEEREREHSSGELSVRCIQRRKNRYTVWSF